MANSKTINKVKAVYKITNKINGKIYIGSSGNLGYRWTSHIYDLQSNSHHSQELQSDWNKYGFSNFTFEVIDLDKDNFLEVEQYNIDKYDSINIGYNSINANKKNKVKTKVNIIENITENDFDKIKKNIIIHGNSKKNKRTYKPLLNNSHSLKWLNSKKNINITKLDLINQHLNVSKLKSGEFIWVTFDTLRNNISGKGNVKCYSSIYNPIGYKSSNLFYMMNIYPSANLENDRDEYALDNILSWIVNNANIDEKFNIYCASERMEFILGRWVGLYETQEEWCKYHKLK